METLSRVEAVVANVGPEFVELQLIGSYETLQWPRTLLTHTPQIGEKIVLELKNHPVAAIQKVVDKAKIEEHDPVEQIRLLESLIN